MNTSLSYQTITGHPIEIVELTCEDDEKILALQVAESIQSAVFLEDDMQDELVFAYHEVFERVVNLYQTPTILMLGGGVCTFPCYVLKKNSGTQIDVVEFDPVMIEIGVRYFGLDEFVDNEGNSVNKRLSIMICSAQDYIDQSPKKYQVIFNDVFDGFTADQTFVSNDALLKISQMLSFDGCYAINLISAVCGTQARALHEIKIRLKQYFKFVFVYPKSIEDPSEQDNLVLVCAHSDLRDRDEGLMLLDDLLDLLESVAL